MFLLAGLLALFSTFYSLLFQFIGYLTRNSQKLTQETPKVAKNTCDSDSPAIT